MAVDPLYSLSAKEIAERGEEEIAEATLKLSKVSDGLYWNFYGSLDNHQELRQESLKRFVQDFGQKVDRYVTGSLPNLSFEDESFSLILCNHFLFLYQEQFDHDFHQKALDELLRVCRTDGQIRIYPLVGFKNDPYPELDRLIKQMEKVNCEVKLEPTNFRFVPGAIHFLKITKY